jgi:PAS domain S-box-containing protein
MVAAAIATLSGTVDELMAGAEELARRNDELLAVRERLAAEERAYRELFELAPDPYVVTDPAGTIEQANWAAARLLGLDRALLTGRALRSFVEPDHHDAYDCRLRELRRGGRAQDWELAVRPGRNSRLVVAADVAPAVGPMGDVEGLRWVLRDVTLARRAQTALQQAFAETTEEYEQLRDLDRWKDAFLAAAAHDLRAPLTTVRRLAERLEQQPTPREEVVRHATDIVDQTDRLRQLLDDLLDLDRFTRGVVTAQREPTDVLALAAAVVAEVAPDDHPVEVLGGPLTAAVDRPRVAQIVRNLVANAVAHTPAGTPIRVRVDRDGDGAVIVVEDEGPGVPDAVRDDLLLPFVSAASHERDRGGTGIGLSLVDLFAQLHGGRVRVEDRDGSGTRFVVELPAAPAA